MIKVLNDTTIAIGEITEDEYDFRIKGRFLYMKSRNEAGGDREYYQNDMLPEGQWEILGRPSSLTFEDKVHIVEHENDGSAWLRSNWYREYITGAWVKDVNVSFATLLESKSLNPDSIILLKKISNE